MTFYNQPTDSYHDCGEVRPGTLKEYQEYILKEALANFRLMNPEERKYYREKKSLEEAQEERQKLLYTKSIMT